MVLGPELMKEISMAAGGADDAKLFGAAAKRIGDAGEDGFPNGVGIIMESEFSEDDIGGIAADGLGLRRQSGDT